MNGRHTNKRYVSGHRFLTRSARRSISKNGEPNNHRGTVVDRMLETRDEQFMSRFLDSVPPLPSESSLAPSMEGHHHNGNEDDMDDDDNSYTPSRPGGKKKKRKRSLFVFVFRGMVMGYIILYFWESRKTKGFWSYYFQNYSGSSTKTGGGKTIDDYEKLGIYGTGSDGTLGNLASLSTSQMNGGYTRGGMSSSSLGYAGNQMQSSTQNQQLPLDGSSYLRGSDTSGFQQSQQRQGLGSSFAQGSQSSMFGSQQQQLQPQLQNSGNTFLQTGQQSSYNQQQQQQQQQHQGGNSLFLQLNDSSMLKQQQQEQPQVQVGNSPLKANNNGQMGVNQQPWNNQISPPQYNTGVRTNQQQSYAGQFSDKTGFGFRANSRATMQTDLIESVQSKRTGRSLKQVKIPKGLSLETTSEQTILKTDSLWHAAKMKENVNSGKTGLGTKTRSTTGSANWAANVVNGLAKAPDNKEIQEINKNKSLTEGEENQMEQENVSRPVRENQIDEPTSSKSLEMATTLESSTEQLNVQNEGTKSTGAHNDNSRIDNLVSNVSQIENVSNPSTAITEAPIAKNATKNDDTKPGNDPILQPQAYQAQTTNEGATTKEKIIPENKHENNSTVETKGNKKGTGDENLLDINTPQPNQSTY